MGATRGEGWPRPPQTPPSRRFGRSATTDTTDSQPSPRIVFPGDSTECALRLKSVKMRFCAPFGGSVCPARTGPLEGPHFCSDDRNLPCLARFQVGIAIAGQNCATLGESQGSEPEFSPLGSRLRAGETFPPAPLQPENILVLYPRGPDTGAPIALIGGYLTSSPAGDLGPSKRRSMKERWIFGLSVASVAGPLVGYWLGVGPAGPALPVDGMPGA